MTPDQDPEGPAGPRRRAAGLAAVVRPAAGRRRRWGRRGLRHGPSVEVRPRRQTATCAPDVDVTDIHDPADARHYRRGHGSTLCPADVSATPTVTLSYDYAGRNVWLDAPAADDDPANHDLCERHADG